MVVGGGKGQENARTAECDGSEGAEGVVRRSVRGVGGTALGELERNKPYLLPSSPLRAGALACVFAKLPCSMRSSAANAFDRRRDSGVLSRRHRESPSETCPMFSVIPGIIRRCILDYDQNGVILRYIGRNWDSRVKMYKTYVMRTKRTTCQALTGLEPGFWEHSSESQVITTTL